MVSIVQLQLMVVYFWLSYLISYIAKLIIEIQIIIAIRTTIVTIGILF